MNRLTVWMIAAPLLLTSCAFTNIHMKLPDIDVNQVPSPGSLGTVTVFVPFSDQRPDQKRCGMQKNSYGSETASALPDKDPKEWITVQFVRGLRGAGFHVVEAAPGSSGPSGIVLRGDLQQLFVEPVLGTWTASLEADLAVRLTATLADGRVVERRFFSKGIKSGVLASFTGFYEVAAKLAAEDSVNKMVHAVIDLAKAPPGL